MNKAIKSMMSLMLLVSIMMPVTAEAERISNGPSTVEQTETTDENSIDENSTHINRAGVRRSGSSYRSGYRAPSGNVRRTPTTPQSPNTTTRSGGGFWRGAALFGAGSLFGSMFHPFGGYYGGGYSGFSFMGLLLDILLIVVIVSIIKRIFRRRY
ncbi:hypothetical protein [Neobacillus dielmonensis]|uniref:hypothetical protein n=1 Tax=Neobacillus dielmonensis TaxID=1347369 RepID=UPI0005A7F047|nr:hypothetical protein [Neobacillus dielmonensis]